MNRSNLWEVIKHTQQTNFRGWLHATKLISFARVKEVFDPQTVLVEEVVLTSAASGQYMVTLLTPSSNAFELYAEPQVGDPVLLLFLQNYDPAMFDLQKEPIYNPDAVGYNHFSGVGLLLSPLKGMSNTTVWHDLDQVSITGTTPYYIELRDTLNLIFGGKGDEVIKEISVLFDSTRPLNEEHWAKVTRKYGTDGSDASVDASVTEVYSEKAPLSVESESTITIKSKDYTLEIDGPFSLESSEDIILKSEDPIFIGNGSNNLADFLKDLIDKVAALVVTGNATIDPTWAPQLNLLKNDIDAFLKN